MIDEFYRIAHKAINFVFLIALPMMLYFMIFAKEGIFFLSGSAYEKSILPMQVIMPTLLFIGLTNVMGIQMLDITGNKEIYKRPEMVHLLKDCKNGSVNLIFSQTRAYIAANTCDFCFLLKYLFDLPMRVDIVTDDDDQRIDTILDFDNQRQSLKDLAEKYTSIRRKDYLEWRIRLEHEMTKAEEK